MMKTAMMIEKQRDFSDRGTVLPVGAHSVAAMIAVIPKVATTIVNAYHHLIALR